MKIGILGGTFDPIHFGHIGLAKEAKVQAKLDKVLFMPTHISPFKINNRVTEDRLRYEMVKISIDGMENFEACDREIAHNGKISYTIDTLRSCSAEFGRHCRLFFIIGTDAFLS
ncbi:MAG: adenylyltransferase/cytidyltransferase family protein, partial [Anaerovorax sp.]